MTTLVTPHNETSPVKMRPVRIWVGAWGLMYDAAQDIWHTPQDFFDSVEQRGIKMEREINRQLGRIGYDLESVNRMLTKQFPQYLRQLQQQMMHTGQWAEDELEKQIEQALERLGIPNRERIEKLTHEIETLNAKIDLELARYAENKA